MNVSKITIGRLYNLGNYEHVRYEITVDVPEDVSATVALIGLENIMVGLNPTRPHGVLDNNGIERAEARLKALEGMTETEVRRQYDRLKADVVKEWTEKLAKAKEKTKRWEEIQLRARSLLDDLGGAEKFTDAKQNWDYDDEF